MVAVDSWLQNGPVFASCRGLCSIQMARRLLYFLLTFFLCSVRELSGVSFLYYLVPPKANPLLQATTAFYYYSPNSVRSFFVLNQQT